MHVLDCLNKLPEQKTSRVFAHRAAALAEVEHESAFDVLQSDVNEVGEHAARTLQDLPIAAVVDEANDVLVAERTEYLYLLLDQLRVGVVITFEELVPQYLQCYFFGWICQVSGEVDLGGIAVA